MLLFRWHFLKWLLLNLKQILFVQLMFYHNCWNLERAESKYEKMLLREILNQVVICLSWEEANASASSLWDSRQTGGTTSSYPSLWFRYMNWSLMTIIAFLWQVEHNSHPWTEKCQIIGHHYYHYRSHTRHMWTVQHHLGTHEPFVCVRCLGTAPGPSGITIQSDKLAKVSTDSKRVQFSPSTV